MPLEPDVPIQSHRWLRRFIPGRWQPAIRGLRKRWQKRHLLREEPYLSVFPYTQVSLVRQRHLVKLAKEIDDKNIPGVIVECGVLDGGTAALVAFATSRSVRIIHLFDSWMGLPKASEKDGNAEAWEGEDVGNQKRVIAAMRMLNVDMARVVFHKGWFDKTFPKANIEQIALLHIDADFYASVKLSLETWYPRLSSGAFVQIDDYSSFVGCKIAVDEFLGSHPDLVLKTFNDEAFFIEIP